MMMKGSTEILRCDTLAAALTYASLGWPIIPDHTPIPGGGCSCGDPQCNKCGKHPRISRWTEAASTAPTVIERWGRDWPEMNIAVLTGARSELVVLDVDPRHRGGDSLDALFPSEELRGLRTPIALTGGGGRHLYFKYPGSPFKTIPNLLPGLELKADGAKVTLPPSLHERGIRYTWELSPFEVEVAPIPKRLLDLAGRRKERGSTIESGGEFIPEGQRNGRLTSIAGAMRRQGASQEAIVAALLEVNERQCLPPLDEQEVRGIAKSASRYTPRPSSLSREPELKVYTAASLQNMVFSPPKWAVPGLIPEGLTILAGPPKVGKSFMALSLCLSVASGGMALGSIETEAGEVLLIALEDPIPRLQRRIESLSDDRPWPADLHLINTCPRAHEGGLEFLENWLKTHPRAKLVVIDTLQKFRKPLGRNSNLYGDDYEAAGSLKSLADRYGVGIVVLHHTKKGEVSDPLEGVSGTMGLSGAADTTLVLKRSRGQGSAELFITGRDVEERTMALRFESPDWRLEGDAEEGKLSLQRKEIIKLLKSSEKPLTPKAIAQALGREYNSTIRGLLVKMADAGQILSHEGEYSYDHHKPHELDKPYGPGELGEPDGFPPSVYGDEGKREP